MKKIENKRWRKNRSIISNWSFMGVLVATGVALTLTLLNTGIALAYPSWRLGSEGLPVKMIGLWFGPIFGFIGGMLTDLLVQMLYPFSALYILHMAMTGFAAGLFVYLKNKVITLFTINSILFGAFVLSIIFVDSVETLKVFGFELHGPSVYIGLIILFGSISLLTFVIWMIDVKRNTKIINILFVVIIMDVIIDVPLISLAIMDTNGTTLVSEMFLRIFSIPAKLVFNTIVLHTAYSYLTPIIKRKLKKGVKVWE